MIEGDTAKMTESVAIIGAGISGICAIKSALDEGLNPVCFEIKTDVGGLWNYSEEVKHGQGSVMKSTIINISKEFMSFSTFPMPPSTPNYIRHTEYKKYLGKYADANNLRDHVRFQTEVLSVKKAPNFINDGKWIVLSKRNNKEVQEEFDFVMVCSGMHGRPNKPQFPGLEKYNGKILHAHEVRHAGGFEGKRILVIGLANTAGDVASELSRVTSQTYLSTRSGAWVYSRVTPQGYPVDYDLVSRRIAARFNFLPLNWALSSVEYLSERRFPNSQYAIFPAGRAHQMEPLFNDHIPSAVVSGQLIIHGDVQEFTEDGAVFQDGTEVRDIDVVIMATGYQIQYPFLGKDVLPVIANKVDLYNYCIPPDLEHHTLAVIACVQPNGPVPMICEMQSRYVTRIFKKLITLPSREEMWNSLEERKANCSMRFRDTMKNAVRIDILPYCDVLAEAIGCKPNLGKMLLTDPHLAWECFFGPVLPYQYRLTGPGNWSGAREAIMTMWERIFPVNKNGKAYKSTAAKTLTLPVLCTILILLVATVFMMILM